MNGSGDHEKASQIEYQLGQIMKSWSRVERVEHVDHFHYAVDGHIFACFYDHNVFLPSFPLDMRMSSTKEIDIQELIPNFCDKLSKSYKISLVYNKFTFVLPVIEQAYRIKILSH